MNFFFSQAIIICTGGYYHKYCDFVSVEISDLSIGTEEQTGRPQFVFRTSKFVRSGLSSIWTGAIETAVKQLYFKLRHLRNEANNFSGKAT